MNTTKSKKSRKKKMKKPACYMIGDYWTRLLSRKIYSFLNLLQRFLHLVPPFGTLICCIKLRLPRFITWRNRSSNSKCERNREKSRTDQLCSFWSQSGLPKVNSKLGVLWSKLNPKQFLDTEGLHSWKYLGH